MPRSVADYVRKWKIIGEEGYSDHEDITPESTLLFQTARSTPMGEGIWPMPDFGDAICFFRYYEIPKDLRLAGDDPFDNKAKDVASTLPGLAIMLDSWQQRKPRLTHEQIAARKAKANTALDALLEDYVRVGYQPDMPDHLRTTANAALTDWELERLWILPGDLPELLKFTGNPLISRDEDDAADEQAAEARAPVFDLNNAEHRAALKERIWEMFL